MSTGPVTLGWCRAARRRFDVVRGQEALAGDEQDLRRGAGAGAGIVVRAGSAEQQAQRRDECDLLSHDEVSVLSVTGCIRSRRPGGARQPARRLALDYLRPVSAIDGVGRAHGGLHGRGGQTFALPGPDSGAAEQTGRTRRRGPQAAQGPYASQLPRQPTTRYRAVPGPRSKPGGAENVFGRGTQRRKCGCGH